MSFVSAQQAAAKWGISKRRVQILCAEQRIPGAVRIGYMWVVPEDAQKPADARRRASDVCHASYTNPIKSARKALRAISVAAFQTARDEIASPANAKRAVMATFVLELLEHLSAEGLEDIVPHIYAKFNAKNQLSRPASSQLRSMFHGFLCEHPFCLDDALSWTYQFINKQSKDSGLEATQFFTEKYMIAALVDQCDIENKAGKILDPACGGGNFLLYALERLYETAYLAPEVSLTDFLHAQMERLYGYELDPTLAIIASVNLRIKVLSILKEHDCSVEAADFFRWEPHIYCSAQDNMEGALDVNPCAHRVVQVGTSREDSLASVFGSAECIFTNPPFQTVKGMDEEQKTFLKGHYPNAKCDMCNAFIEFVLKTVADDGICGMVTQNSWMYLSSFEPLRKSLFEQYSIKSVIELGSNAFYDISGEKANVALLLAQKSRPNAETSITAYSLKHLSKAEMETVLPSEKSLREFAVPLKQLEMMHSPGAKFGVLSTRSIQSLQVCCPSYGKYAIPMQGTSTGDAKSLVGYFWEHIGDPDWIPVSKGGGYSRWLGLNNYSVKWGTDGEYIRAISGSAIRNAKYFDETQMVFSDTGTAGLNVRLLRNGQIFIASGPGIRIIEGDPHAHLAFLNSRFSSYFVRLLSPKLTIAAGYIAQIPVLEELLSSKELAAKANDCIEAKRSRLSRRPVNLEFEPPSDAGRSTTLGEEALQWFLRDMEDEWRQLCTEHEMDHAILAALDLALSDKDHIDRQVGRHALDLREGRPLQANELDRAISELLDPNCMLNRTRPDKNHLGCDGILEYMAHKHAIPPGQLHAAITQHAAEFPKTLAKYHDAYLHALVLSVLGYSAHSLPEMPQKIDQVMERMATLYPSHVRELDSINESVRTNLNPFHAAAFFGTPIIRYSSKYDVVEWARRSI